MQRNCVISAWVKLLDIVTFDNFNAIINCRLIQLLNEPRESHNILLRSPKSQTQSNQIMSHIRLNHNCRTRNSELLVQKRQSGWRVKTRTHTIKLAIKWSFHERVVNAKLNELALLKWRIQRMNEVSRSKSQFHRDKFARANWNGKQSHSRRAHG